MTRSDRSFCAPQPSAPQPSALGPAALGLALAFLLAVGPAPADAAGEAAVAPRHGGAAPARGGVDSDGDGIPDAADNCAEDFNPTQFDSNGDGFGNRCDPDVDNDGFITNFGDLALLKNSFFATSAAPPCPGGTPGGLAGCWSPDLDFTEDDAVGFADLAIMKEAFFGPPGPIAITFVNPAGGDWGDPANWLPPVVPTTIHTVRIDLDPGVVVEFDRSGDCLDNEIAGLRVTSPLLISGGCLSVRGDVQTDSVITLGGGTLANANILPPTTEGLGAGIEVPASTTGVLDNVILGADAIVRNGGTLQAPAGLTLADATVTLASEGGFTRLDFVSGEQTLGGIGEVVFGGNSTFDSSNTVWTNNGDLLTIGAGVTLRTGTAGGTLGWSSQELLLEGQLVSDLPGRTLNVAASPATLRGSITASGGANLSITGEWTNASGNTFTLSGGGSMRLDGMWLNAAGATISATGGELELFGAWKNSGLISVSDGFLEIGAPGSFDGAWANNGTIEAIDSPVELGGTFDLAGLGTFNTTGDLLFDGRIDNTGQTLDLGTALPGNVTLGSGAVLGGTLAGTAVSIAPFATFTLDGVSVATDVTIENGATLRAPAGLVLDDASVTLASTGSFTLLDFVSGEQTVGGTGEIVFGGTSTSDSSNTVWTNNGNLLTIGPGVTLRTGTTSGTLGWSVQQLALQGTLVSDVAGRNMLVQASPLNLTGSAQASGGGGFVFTLGGASSIAGPVSATGTGTVRLAGQWSLAPATTVSTDGGELELFGDWTSTGQISVSNGILDIGDDFGDEWDNDGVIDVDSADVELGGGFSLADIGVFNTSGSVLFDGSVDNAGQSLDLFSDLPGIVTLGSGRVAGGTVTGAPLSLTGTFTLDTVTLATDVTVENGATLRLPGGITLASATIDLASTGSFTLVDFVSGEQTLGGTGAVVYNGSAGGDNSNTVWTNTGARLTVGPDVTVRTGTVGGTLGWSSQSLLVQGRLQSDVDGRSLLVSGNDIDVEGTLDADAGAEIAFSGAYTLSAAATVELEIGGTDAGDFGRVTSPAGTVDLDGSLDASLTGGYTPAACDEFDVLSWLDRNGTFATFNGPDLGGSSFEVLYLLNDLRLETPDPGGPCSNNLSLFPGATATASSDFGPTWGPEQAINGVNATTSSWCTANNDPAPQIEVALPAAATVEAINVLTSWSPTFDFLTGRFEIFDGSDALIYDSGVVSLTGGEISLDVVPDAAAAQRIRFSGVTWNSIEPCLSELEIIGFQP